MESVEATTVISKATAICLQSFKYCQDVKVLAKGEWAENRLADFNLWVYSSGAAAKGRASLDSRLSLKPEIQNIIVNLLYSLSKLVDGCKKLAISSVVSYPTDYDKDEESRGRKTSSADLEPTGRSFSPWSNESDSDQESLEGPKVLHEGNELQKSMRNVELMLEQLVRIAVAIRKSGKRSRLQKADQQFNREHYKNLENHLVAIVLTRPEFSLEQIDASRLSDVQKRLIYCNLKRRNRFMCAQQHSRRLHPEPGKHFRFGLNLAAVKGQIEEQTEDKAKITGASQANPADGAVNPTVKTGTTASALSNTFAMQALNIPTQATSTVMSSTVMDIDYPRPPKITEGTLAFVCPCCCQTLPISYSERNRWKHVAEDLSPYTCILPNCTKHDLLFTTKETWKQHLLKEHLSFEYWICFSCGDGIQFQSKDGFVAHMNTSHSSTTSAEQLTHLANICKRSVPVQITSCPLCKWPEGETDEVDKDTILNHIARDIHSFSLRALPWADDNGQETANRIDHSTCKVHDWLVKYNLSNNGDQEIPLLEDKVYFSDHFQQHPYFAGSSLATSGTETKSTDSIDKELKKWKEDEGSVEFQSTRSSLPDSTHSHIDPVERTVQDQDAKPEIIDLNDPYIPTTKASPPPQPHSKHSSFVDTLDPAIKAQLASMEITEAMLEGNKALFASYMKEKRGQEERTAPRSEHTELVEKEKSLLSRFWESEPALREPIPPYRDHGLEPHGVVSSLPPSVPIKLKEDDTERDALWPMFKAVDQDGSGELSEIELQRALVNKDWSQFDPTTVRMMIRMFDVDRDGSLNFDQFCNLWGFLSAWRSLFDRFDVDKSGYLSQEQFSDAIIAFGYRLSPQFVQLWFRTYDKRGLKSLQFDLFVQATISLKRMTDSFKNFDTDRDGYITLSFEDLLTEMLRFQDKLPEKGYPTEQRAEEHQEGQNEDEGDGKSDNKGKNKKRE